MVNCDIFKFRWTALLSFGIVLFFQCVLEVSSTKCLRDENYGDIAANIYYCEESDKPECCTEGAQFTCCESKSKKTLKDQLILWGAVVGVGLLIALGCVYFWKDSCGKDDDSRGCCCCRRTVNTGDTDTIHPKPGTSSFTPAPWGGGGRGSFSASERDSPAPTFNFKSPSYSKY